MFYGLGYLFVRVRKVANAHSLQHRDFLLSLRLQFVLYLYHADFLVRTAYGLPKWQRTNIVSVFAHK